MDKIWEFVLNNLGTVVVVLLAIFDITPMKPIRRICKWIGKAANSELNGRFTTVEEQIKEINASISSLKSEIKEVTDRVEQVETTIDENEMDRIRSEILKFADECRQKLFHSKESFDHIISQADKYEMLLKKTNTDNGVFELSFGYIKEMYQDCLKNDKFI